MLIYQEKKNYPAEIEIKHDVQVMPIALALCRASKSSFEKNPINAEIALSLIRDPSQLNTYLLETGASTAAGRLVGAYQHFKNQDFAEQILSAMQAAGYRVEINNPFISSYAGMLL